MKQPLKEPSWRVLLNDSAFWEAPVTWWAWLASIELLISWALIWADLSLFIILSIDDDLFFSSFILNICQVIKGHRTKCLCLPFSEYEHIMHVWQGCHNNVGHNLVFNYCNLLFLIFLYKKKRYFRFRWFISLFLGVFNVFKVKFGFYYG